VITFGCRVNQADSLGLEEQLRAYGAVAAPLERADLVIVNTCSVTESADQGARQTIRRIARENPGARIIVTGCYATRDAEAIAALPNVRRVVPNSAKPRLIPLVAHDLGLTTAHRFGDGNGSCGQAIEPGVAGRTAFTLRVQSGCGERCSYCIIPTTRGRPRSLPLDDVLAEVARVVDAGFKEIALTGVHLGSYGRDLSPACTLGDLLGAIACFDRADVLFRVSSLEPMDCSDEIVDLVATAENVAKHFHLPLQHASNRLLAGMRRPYTLERYAGLVDQIRRLMPAASIGADVIVGFPGESDDDFEQLTSYLERSPLTHLHVFPYSDRPGTEASAMRDKVPGAIVRARARRVREIGLSLSAAFRDTQIGTVHKALTIEDGSLVVTGNYLKLRVASGRPRNEWVRVRALSHHDGELLGG
jgi:threonylcarbamoyladenosine tRNA methylthiotransferase MtaB